MSAAVSVSRGRIVLILLVVACLLAGVGLLCWFLKPDNACVDCTVTTADGMIGRKVVTQAPAPSRTGDCTPFGISEPWTHLRLPCHTRPTHYDITLYPDFYGEHATFSGSVSVHINVTEATNYLLIHIKKMNITKTNVALNGDNLKIKKTFEYRKNEFWVTEMESPIAKGSNVSLQMDFNGSLENGIVGFYKSRYTNSKTGELRSLATSKFEPVDARKAFPCFDEPNIKATYTVSLIHQKEYTALSNMPVERMTEANGLVKTHFQKSVPMSTYLVCFIVCDFTYKEITTKNGVPLRIYATPDKIDQVDYARNLSKQVTDYFEEFFNMSYPLPKLDMIAIPDFVSGAMEHWGLVTFRETNLLFNPREASDSNKQRVAVVIAHELAHMWFGNIVTMDWWDDLWLNEGFASFMEYKGVASYEKDWQMNDQMIVEDMQGVMATDSKLSSHPIVVNVERPAQITEVFDSISYSKGASVIRLLEGFMGKDNFKKGISRYLKKYEYKNAKTDDLWNTLDEVYIPAMEGFTVKVIMDTWTRQMGYPVINVTFTSSKAVATQQRYLTAGTDSDNKSPYGYKWCVPLHYTSSANKKLRQAWMNKEERVEFDIPVDMTGGNSWVKFNVDQTGFYRVNYPDDIWLRYAGILESSHTTFSTADRAGLINDAFNLVRSGYITYKTALALTKYLKKERQYLPWDSAYSSLAYISARLQDTELFSTWRKYVISLCKPVLDEIGWRDDDSHLDKYLRSDLVALACWHGDMDCLLNATSIFKRWIYNDTAWIAPNYRSSAYRYGIQKSGLREWDAMWRKYRTATVPQERVKLLYGLSQIREPWILSRYLTYARNESLIKSQDFFTVLIYTARNPVGNPIVWTWVRSNWLYLVGRFGIDHRYLGRLVPSVVSSYSSEFKLKQVKSFFAKYPDAGAGARGRQQALESIEANIKWLSDYQQDIGLWLRTR